MSARVCVRAEEPSDDAAIDAVNRDAFGRAGEAELVRALRREAHPLLSLVALDDGVIAGHVMMSPVDVAVAAPAPVAAAGLGPVAVTRALQRRGIGAGLVRAVLARAPSVGWQAVFVLGDPDYYARFGFTRADARALQYEHDGFEAVFQVLELVPGALAHAAGRVRYHAAFAAV